MAELQNPVRTVTSTVRVARGPYRRCPVKTLHPIPKHLAVPAVEALSRVELSLPVREGQIVLEDVCGTGIPWNRDSLCRHQGPVITNMKQIFVFFKISGIIN